MQRRQVIVFKNYVLLAAAFVAAGVGFAMSGPFEPGSVVILFWIISPYLYFLLATYLFETLTSVTQVPAIGLVISFLMLGFTLITYPSVLFGDHNSSTEGLIFIFIPFWLYVGNGFRWTRTASRMVV